MKRIICAVLSIGIILALIGCRPTAETEIGITETAQMQTGENQTGNLQTDSHAAVPMVSVSLPTFVQSEIASDGTEIFRYVFQNIHPLLPEQDIADRVIIDFLNRTDKTAAAAEDIRTQAKRDYTGSSNWNAYLCQLLYEPTRIDEGVLSLYGCYVTYNGGIHPETTYLSVNYDLSTGKVLQFEDILSDTANLSQLESEINNALALQKEEKSLYPDYEIAVKEHLSGGADNVDNWYFSQTGLCIYFSPYEIAPYASGVIRAEVPYGKLAGILNNAYFPAEREKANGKIMAINFDGSQLDQFEAFSEIILRENSKKILLTTNSTVYDIRLETGTYFENTKTFSPENTVYAAYGLTPDKGVLLEADLTAGLRSLRLSYVQGDKTVYRFITLDENSSPLLLPE